MLERILGVIPARGGSKGLPGKNISDALGDPLIVYSLRLGQSIPMVSRVIVTTDDEEIAAVVRDYGGDAPFLRPQNLAIDETPMAPVIRHALDAIETEEGSAYDAVLLLDPTSPTRDPKYIVEAIGMLDSCPQADGVVSVSQPYFDPTWVGVEVDSKGCLSRFFSQAEGVTRRQDNDRRYLRVNGSFYLWRSEFVRRMKSSWLDEGIFLAFEIPEIEAYSIDNEQELQLVRAVTKAGLAPLPQGESA